MKHLQITSELQKRIKRGMVFVLVGTMLVTSASVIPKDKKSNGRHHVLQQEIETLKTLEVSQGVNLYLDDHVLIPKDANGNEVFPFIHNGTTYLPIRAITSALGCEVGYANQTAVITRPQEATMHYGIDWRYDMATVNSMVYASSAIQVKINEEDFIPTDINGNEVPIYLINGTTYVPVRALCDAFDIPVVWDGRNRRVYLGSHIELVDPTIHNDPTDQLKQNYCNLALVTIQQQRMDIQTLNTQFTKLDAFMDTLIATYSLVTGTYHDELEHLHATIGDIYYELYVAIHNYTSQLIQEEWDNMSNKMEAKERLDINVYRFFMEAYSELSEKIAKWNSYCTDEEIANLYRQLEDIVNRYNQHMKNGKMYSK